MTVAGPAPRAGGASSSASSARSCLAQPDGRRANDSIRCNGLTAHTPRAGERRTTRLKSTRRNAVLREYSTGLTGGLDRRRPDVDELEERAAEELAVHAARAARVRARASCARDQSAAATARTRPRRSRAGRRAPWRTRARTRPCRSAARPSAPHAPPETPPELAPRAPFVPRDDAPELVEPRTHLGVARAPPPPLDVLRRVQRARSP